MIRFLCPYCRSVNSVSDDIRETVCGSCDKKIPVPDKDDFSSLLPDKTVANKRSYEIFNKRMRFYNFFKKFFDVRFDELTVFIMSSSFLILLCTNQILRQEIYKLYLSICGVMLSGKSGKESIGNIAILTILSLGILLPFIVGIVVSIINVFTDREKSGWTKYFMFSFAWMMSLIGGFVCGFQMLMQAYMRDLWFLTIFPIINLSNTFLLLIKLNMQYGEHSDTSSPRKSVKYAIKDDDASRIEVIIASVVNLVVILLAQYAFKLHWSITFSICCAYAMNFCKIWQKLFRRITG